MKKRLGTSALRAEFSDSACKAAMMTLFTFHNGTRVTIHKETVAAWEMLDRIFKHFNYLPEKGITGAYVCRKITGGSGYSLHSYGVAVDVSWSRNPYRKPRPAGADSLEDLYRMKLMDQKPEMVRLIMSLQTKSGAPVFDHGATWRSLIDSMHIQIACTRADLRSGVVAPSVIALGPSVELEPEPEPTVEEVMSYLTENLTDDEQKFLVDVTRALIAEKASASSLAYILKKYREARTQNKDGGEDSAVINTFLS